MKRLFPYGEKFFFETTNSLDSKIIFKYTTNVIIIMSCFSIFRNVIDFFSNLFCRRWLLLLLCNLHYKNIINVNNQRILSIDFIECHMSQIWMSESKKKFKFSTFNSMNAPDMNINSKMLLLFMAVCVKIAKEKKIVHWECEWDILLQKKKYKIRE